MRPGGGRSKGNAFERLVAKMVVAAFSGLGITRKDCYRTPSSGGHKFARKTDPGDLVLSTDLSMMLPFHFECKHIKKASVASFFGKFYHKSGREVRRKKELVWLDQVVKESKPGFRPLVVFKAEGVVYCTSQHRNIPVSKYTEMQYVYAGETWKLMRFDQFLQLWVNDVVGPSPSKGPRKGSKGGTSEEIRVKKRRSVSV